MIQDQTLRNMWERLEKFHWSPEPPEFYTIVYQGKRAGIGIIAHKNYGAFNAAWALGYDLKSLEGQTKAIEFWQLLAHESSTQIDGASLESWLTLLNKESFNEWYRLNRDTLAESTREKLDRIGTGDVQSF